MMDQPDQRWDEEASDPETNADRLSELSANPCLRMAVAANPTVPEHLLEHLAQDHDQEVLRAVASNPNASWRTLEDLAWAFPREVLHNPLGLLQILAHPEQISTDDTFWESMLREAWLPPLWWKWLRSHPVLHVHPALRLHVQAAGEASSFAGVPQEEEAGTLLILVSLLTEAHAQGVRLPMLRHPDQSTIPVEQIIREHLRWVAQHGDDLVRMGVASNSYTPREVLLTLAQDEHHGVRRDVASNPQTPREVLLILAQDQNEWVRFFVVSNPQTPREVLHTLAQDEHHEVRRDVASSPQTPKEVLYTLAQDEHYLVRGRVALNPQTPREVLQILAQDENHGVRGSVALNSHMPREVLQILAQDENEWVRRCVAHNSQTPREVLHTLAQDERDDVRMVVAHNPQTPREVLHTLAQDCTWFVRRGVASNSQTPKEVLHTLAQDQDERVRFVLASSPQTPKEVLHTLTQDQDERVRFVLVSSPQTPKEVLHTLAQDQDERVRRRARLVLRVVEIAEREEEGRWRKELSWISQGLSEDDDPIRRQLEWIVYLDVAEPMRQAIITALVPDWDDTMVRFAFGHDIEDHLAAAPLLLAAFMPPLALQKLAVSPSWKVRYLVALHPRTPLQTRQRLSQDGNRYVRAMARANLEPVAGSPSPFVQ